MKYRIIRRLPSDTTGKWEPWCEADNIGLLEAILMNVSFCRPPYVYRIIDVATGEVQD